MNDNFKDFDELIFGELRSSSCATSMNFIYCPNTNGDKSHPTNLTFLVLIFRGFNRTYWYMIYQIHLNCFQSLKWISLNQSENGSSLPSASLHSSFEQVWKMCFYYKKFNIHLLSVLEVELSKLKWKRQQLIFYRLPITLYICESFLENTVTENFRLYS